MKRRFIPAIVALLILGAALGISASGAALTSANASTISAATTSASTLLHLYSQSSDPDSLTGYYIQPGTSTLAASGADFTLAVNLGKQPATSTARTRIFTIKAPSSFPSGITSITVTASLVADAGTGLQPITAIGFATVGGTGRTNPVTLTAGVKRQCNLTVAAAKPTGTIYHPTVVIKVTYTGYTGSFFQYSVPFSVTAN